MNTPTERRQLVATEGMLSFKSAQNQYARIDLDNRWNFAGDFTLSVIGSVVSTCGVIGSLNSTNGTEIGISCPSSGTLNIRLNTDTESDITENIDVPGAGFVRITLSRASGVLSIYANNRLSSSVAASGAVTLFTSAEELIIGANHDLTGYLDGVISQLLALNGKGMTAAEVEEWHYSNIPPDTTHEYVVAHYRCNNDYGDALPDSVTDYNYAKDVVDVLTAINGALINYTTDELGDTNPATQERSVGFYDGSLRNNLVMSGDGVDMYMAIPSYSPSPSTWALYVEFWCDPAVTGYNGIWGAGSSNLGFGVVLNSSQIIVCYLGNQNTYTAITGINKLWIIFDGSNRFYRVNGIENTVSSANETFNEIRWLSQFPGNPLYSANGVSRSIMSTDVPSARERLMIESREIQLLSNELFNIDFGSVFESGGNYFARDLSGNNRHARLYGFVLADNIPTINPVTGVPQRKALKLNGTDQYVSITNFNPTKESGYTTVIGFKLNSVLSANGIFGKRGGGYLKVFFLSLGDPTTFYYYYSTTSNSSNSTLADSKTADGILWLIAKEPISTGTSRLILNGLLVSTSGDAGNRIGFNEISGDLTIGLENGNYADMYCVHASVYKGITTQAEDLDLIHLNKPPKRLWNDCQLYLNFEQFIDDSGTIRIKDWSPQGRTSSITAHNYSSAEVDPDDPLYAILPLSDLI